MRKLYKLMSIGSITIELDDHAAKELSRVKFRVIEDSDPRKIKPRQAAPIPPLLTPTSTTIPFPGVNHSSCATRVLKEPSRTEQVGFRDLL